MRSNTILAITMGEPAGIGGELSLKAWSQRDSTTPVFFCIDNPERLGHLGNTLGLNVPIESINSPVDAISVFSTALPVLSLNTDIFYELGKPNTLTANATCESIKLAVSLSLKKQISGFITAPIQKKNLYNVGFSYPGQTEFIASLVGSQTPTMMIASPDLRVALVSIHQSLFSAITKLTQNQIVEATKMTSSGLKTDFGINNPRIAIAGLNPHSGEEGSFGSEEIEIINPAINILKSEGLNVFGPVPPDSMFTHRARATYDAGICHYHDQALIPIKTLAVDEAVNVTLGLPIVRTSPDHGTALDIAAEGVASPKSLIYAIKMANIIANNRASKSRQLW